MIRLLTLILIFTQAVWAQSGAIKGRVVDEKRKAIQGATVKAIVDGKETATSTNEKGEFLIEGLMPAEYLVVAECAGYKTVELIRKQRVEKGKTTKLQTEIEMPLSIAYTLLKGAVFNESGYSLPGAKVTVQTLEGEGYKKDYITSQAGSFAFRLPPQGGKYEVRARAKGFQEAKQVVELQAGESRSIAFSLKAE